MYVVIMKAKGKMCMKKVIISLFVFCLMCLSVKAEPSISRVGFNAPARLPSYSAPIRSGGFTTSFVRNTPLRTPAVNVPDRIQPINGGGFTTAFPKDTVIGRTPHRRYNTPVVQRMPRHYSAAYSSNGVTRKVYKGSSRTASSSVSSCRGITYYDRSGNVSRCN